MCADRSQTNGQDQLMHTIAYSFYDNESKY